MKERIQKIISSSGIASRRAGEELIKAGKVTVNGLPAKLGDSADADADTICVDGRVIGRREGNTYIMLNKPRGYVTTLNDEKGRPCISRLVKDVGKRVYPVGRLDMYSEGLLILTDDGEFANRLTHPSHEITKTYHAWIKGECSDEILQKMRRSFIIDGYKTQPAEVELLFSCPDYSKLSIGIHEGRNRQIRKICEQVGLKLTKLKRISEGTLILGDLKPGKWRELTEKELQDMTEYNGEL